MDLTITDSIVKTEDPRAALWAEARRLWLGGLAMNTQRAYGQAWDAFEESCQVEPWEASRADVARWVQEMRDLGLADATIGQRVAAVGSFYRYCGEEYTQLVDGKEVPLTGYNPAAGKTLRPQVQRYGKARALTPAETRALLKAVRGQQGEQGLRDYALMLGYLFTGRRNSEWRTARWGDFEEAGGAVYYRWAGKGKDGRLEIPSPVWGAVKAYLMATRRLMRMGQGDFIFLGGATQGKPAGSGPIASNQVGRLLKKYCRQAGLNEQEIHVHSLRHTAAMLRREAGDDVEGISRWLVHSSLAVTQVYLHELDQPRDTTWAKVSELLGLADPRKEGANRDDKRSYRPYARRRAK
jgi:integrase